MKIPVALSHGVPVGLLFSLTLQAGAPEHLYQFFSTPHAFQNLCLHPHFLGKELLLPVRLQDMSGAGSAAGLRYWKANLPRFFVVTVSWITIYCALGTALCPRYHII